MIVARTVRTYLRVTIVLAAIAACQQPAAIAEQSSVRTLFWWQDELRCVCQAVSLARTGAIAQWPQMTVPTGSAVLPVPRAATAIVLDGQLDETAWQAATSFPVGPIFDDWRAGPFLLQVRACRDDQQIFLAIESPRDLTDLSSLSPNAELFAVNGQPFFVGAEGGLPVRMNAERPGQYVLELSVPLSSPVRLSFAVEALRRPHGDLPLGAAALGWNKHQVQPAGHMNRRAQPAGSQTGLDDPTLPLWLRPITVQLVPCDSSLRCQLTSPDNVHWQLTTAVSAPGTKVATDSAALGFSANQAVLPYAWQATLDGQAFSLNGFLYREPAITTWEAAGQLADRAADARRRDRTQHRAELGIATTPPSVSSDELAPGDQSPRTWRAVYCQTRELRSRAQLSLLDAPLLFVKQHPYFAGHIYDDFYPWYPGGGIYVLENPAASGDEWVMRAVIDPATNETLGAGVYRDPDLSWDARKLVFAHKAQPEGVTSLYEIGIDGRGLKRLTSSDTHSDFQPAYLPDERVVFISTRPRALVPCFNSGVGTLHTMNPDGSDIQAISVNNVNEFDPSILPDGRILYGRWEYVDKTALYMQSLWTMQSDGRMEEALYANNLPKPTALLDARAVPGSAHVVASLTPHNGQPVGAIGMVNTAKGKNDLAAVFNFTPEYPVEMDQGLRVGPCDPWPLSETDVLMSNNAIGEHGILELVDRAGNRELVYADAEISCYAPMLVKSRSQPPTGTPHLAPDANGRFLVLDVYRGLEGVARGSAKRLRVVEETARTSGLPPGGRWWNQAFLVSWQGAYIVKNILGTVPVQEDGSAYFEAPAGRAIYFELLDAEGREIQRMRTFVQAAPGTTRACIGCHENKKGTPAASTSPPLALANPPAQLEPESWGSGYIDYPTMIQPIWDKHCVRCHGGEQDIAHGIDLSGGWTWAFNLSYETLLKHRLTGFLNCNNASVHTSQILPPHTIGSGAAPLAEVLIRKHPEVSRAERDLVLAWMDTNSNYYGSWDYTQFATCDALLNIRGPLAEAMRQARCTECHPAGHIGNDWVNLQTPAWSRILRAPMARTPGGLGLAMCRKRTARTGYPLIDQSVQPPDVVLPSLQPVWDESGEPHVTLASEHDPHYQAILQITHRAQAEALARPRVDMPGADVVPGECRMQVPVAVPEAAPALRAEIRADRLVELSWPRTAETIGLQYELHRSDVPGFAPEPATRIGLTTAGRLVDAAAGVGQHVYALVVSSGPARSAPVWTSLDVAPVPPPAIPAALSARPLPGEIVLTWEGAALPGVRYDLYRADRPEAPWTKLTPQPLTQLIFSDTRVEAGADYRYAVSARDRRGQESPLSPPVSATPLPEVREPVFVTDFTRGAQATLLEGATVHGELHGAAKIEQGALALGPGGFLSFAHRQEFELGPSMSVECWVWIERESAMPVILSAGGFNDRGWFLQRYAGGWRWHTAPSSCDGGQPATGHWVHLVATVRNGQACLYQDGTRVADVACTPQAARWNGPLIVGQYSVQSESYQVLGKITRVALYRRALPPEEVAQHFAAGP
jgi:hypothetical protein